MRHFLQIALACACALSISMFTLTAEAQQSPPDPNAEARTRFEHGQALTTQGDFRAALSEFEIGYGLSHRPLFLFNMAECARSLGENDRARTLYERYLAEDPQATLAETARQRLAALPARTAPVVTARVEPAPTPHDQPVVFSPSEVAAADMANQTTAPGPLADGGTHRRDEGGGSIFTKWPFWVGVGAVIATAVVIGVVVAGSNGNSGPQCGAGCVDFR